MQLKADNARVALVVETRLSGVASLPYDTVVYGELVACLHRLLDVPSAYAAIHGLRGRTMSGVSNSTFATYGFPEL